MGRDPFQTDSMRGRQEKSERFKAQEKSIAPLLAVKKRL